ncbi:essential MCU regulator, mitochondrial [Drosophila kikkawai]|uniref:Essential MCU regulator, mitochondrial n=1 Tax=Drosophila kikkawai TaxID=30033 RepID=A0A6P4IM86_DROKI|nr:essential MCU regulator, mitochondrial [Drosophila kikkawai]KAH8334256.1 hypothetical protein KR059_007965 [Drosophila kikkawai]
MPFGRRDKDFKELKKIQKADKLIYFRVVATVIPGILLGGYAGMKIAQFLEVCELFTPDTVENDD